MNHCTKASPAPAVRSGAWSHSDVVMTSGNPIKRYGDSARYDCPNCKGKIKMTMTEQGLYENAQVVAPVATEIADEVAEIQVPQSGQ